MFNAGCGRKAPPLVPLNEQPQPPSTLEYQLHKEVVTIKWAYTGDNEDFSRYQGFQVFKAARDISEDGCVGCPLAFKQQASLLSMVFEYSEKIEKGFRYYYRIRAFTGKNIFSEYSKTIQFEFK